MKKKYVFNNAIVYIIKPENIEIHIKEATEHFLKKVILEEGRPKCQR